MRCPWDQGPSGWRSRSDGRAPVAVQRISVSLIHHTDSTWFGFTPQRKTPTQKPGFVCLSWLGAPIRDLPNSAGPDTPEASRRGCADGDVRSQPQTGQLLLPRLRELLRPAIIEVLVDAFLAASSAMLSSPRRPSSTILIFSSETTRRCVARRISRTFFSGLCGCPLCLFLIFTPYVATMSQKHSFRQSPQSVPWALTPDMSAMGGGFKGSAQHSSL